jgi:hypothetical protein
VVQAAPEDIANRQSEIKLLLSAPPLTGRLFLVGTRDGGLDFLPTITAEGCPILARFSQGWESRLCAEKGFDS